VSTTAIEWTEATWNPVTGCDRVSPGCAHCYALSLAARLKRMGNLRYQVDGDPGTSGPGFGVTLHEDKLDEPRRRRTPTMYFVNSMSDLFHEEVPDEFIARVFDAMRLAPQHTFQVLTKRPERMAELVPLLYDYLTYDILEHDEEFLPNVWLGVSIENRRYVHRADLLRQTPAAVRFISAEPLLGPLVYDDDGHPLGGRAGVMWRERWRDCSYLPQLDLDGIDWLIVGGESGPKHRAMREEWVVDLLELARERGTAFFFKQWGGRTPKAGGRKLDGRTWDEMPAREVVAA
jgi:protein gp37